MKTADGRELQLPLARLSEADQQWIQAAAKATDKPATHEPGTSEPGTSEPATSDATSAETIAMNAQPTWSLTPSQPTIPAQKLVDKPIMLSAHLGHPFFEQIRVVGFDRVGGRAWIFRGSRDGAVLTNRVEQVDLVNGKTVGIVTYPEKTEILAVDPAGRFLATRPDEGYGKNDRIDLWDLSGLEPKVTLNCKPFAETTASRKDVGTATFVGSEHLLVVAAHGEIAVWSIPGKKAVYFFAAKGEPAVSDNGKYLAAATRRACLSMT